MNASTANVSEEQHAKTLLGAEDIAPLSHREATELATVESGRMLTLLDSLSSGDWDAPTNCERWRVREIVAHLVGEAAGYTSFSEGIRQNSGRAQRPYRKQGFSKLDAMNQIQVEDRAGATSSELLAELRRVVPKAIRTRARIPAPIRALPLPLGLAFPFKTTWVPVGYLTDIILTRDMWMHRLDISLAIGRPMELTEGHDGRITALVVRDLVPVLSGAIGQAPVRYELAGLTGGSWYIGAGSAEPTIVRMNVLDFHLLASGRTTSDALLKQGRVSSDSDSLALRRVLDATSVVY